MAQIQAGGPRRNVAADVATQALSLAFRDWEPPVRFAGIKPIPIGLLKVIEGLRVGRPQAFVEERKLGVLFPAGQQP